MIEGVLHRLLWLRHYILLLTWRNWHAGCLVVLIAAVIVVIPLLEVLLRVILISLSILALVIVEWLLGRHIEGRWRLLHLERLLPMLLRGLPWPLWHRASRILPSK